MAIAIDADNEVTIAAATFFFFSFRTALSLSFTPGFYLFIIVLYFFFTNSCRRFFFCFFFHVFPYKTKLFFFSLYPSVCIRLRETPAGPGAAESTRHDRRSRPRNEIITHDRCVAVAFITIGTHIITYLGRAILVLVWNGKKKSKKNRLYNNRRVVIIRRSGTMAVRMRPVVTKTGSPAAGSVGWVVVFLLFSFV